MAFGNTFGNIRKTNNSWETDWDVLCGGCTGAFRTQGSSHAPDRHKGLRKGYDPKLTKRRQGSPQEHSEASATSVATHEDLAAASQH
jgi:hypothetical protein